MTTTTWKPQNTTVQNPAPAQKADSVSQTATRKLVVGRGIVFSGEIKSCDCLVVEGTVKANIADCHDINIAEGGLFTGSASVDRAEIRGRFEGTLAVAEHLLIHSTGRVAAEVRYNQIEIERGGEISGTIQAQASGATVPAKPVAEAVSPPAATVAIPRRA
jgi:cytoskeletal protein CcmA (bactofilin family)